MDPGSTVASQLTAIVVLVVVAGVLLLGVRSALSQRSAVRQCEKRCRDLQYHRQYLNEDDYHID